MRIGLLEKWWKVSRCRGVEVAKGAEGVKGLKGGRLGVEKTKKRVINEVKARRRILSRKAGKLSS